MANPLAKRARRLLNERGIIVAEGEHQAAVDREIQEEIRLYEERARTLIAQTNARFGDANARPLIGVKP